MTKSAFQTPPTDKRWCQRKKKKTTDLQILPRLLQFLPTELISDLRQTLRMLNEQSFSCNKLVCWDCMLFSDAGYQILAEYMLCMLSKEGNEQVRKFLLLSTSVWNPPPPPPQKQYKKKPQTRKSQNTYTINSPPPISSLCSINSVFNMKQWTHPCQILTFTWL